MKTTTDIPLEAVLTSSWQRIHPASRAAFLAVALVSLLAFGFEMTNLTLHHDDLNHLMVQKPLVGYYLGRFLNAWLFFYVQQGHYAPFFDMAIGMTLMCVYGVVVARFWGADRALDIAVVAAIACVFPYMAQVYQYNAAMVAYPLAHLLSAGGVVLAARARVLSTLMAAGLFFAAFSIYQSVLANAITIFLVWLLTRALFRDDTNSGVWRGAAKSTAAAMLAVALGGVLHVVAVSLLNIPFDAAQGADKAFSLRSRLDEGFPVAHAAWQVLRGTRDFFLWPEPYMPAGLKLVQATLFAAAGLCCLAHPRGLAAKGVSLALLGLVALAPRTVQFIHPDGAYHQLTLTAYALVIGAAALIVSRAGGNVVRNASLFAAFALVVGYVAQCNWISTVNHLNTQAHVATLTQILARIRSLPDTNWDGKTIVVVGEYDMSEHFPFVRSTGIAPEFMRAYHMGRLAQLMRDEATFVPASTDYPSVRDWAASRPAWPHPASVGVVDGVGVVVLGQHL